MFLGDRHRLRILSTGRSSDYGTLYGLHNRTIERNFIDSGSID